MNRFVVEGVCREVYAGKKVAVLRAPLNVMYLVSEVEKFLEDSDALVRVYKSSSRCQVVALSGGELEILAGADGLLGRNFDGVLVERDQVVFGDLMTADIVGAEVVLL